MVNTDGRPTIACDPRGAFKRPQSQALAERLRPVDLSASEVLDMQLADAKNRPQMLRDAAEGDPGELGEAAVLRDSAAHAIPSTEFERLAKSVALTPEDLLADLAGFYGFALESV